MVGSEPFTHSSDLVWELSGDGVRRKTLGIAREIMMASVEFRQGSAGRVSAHPHHPVAYVESGRFEVELEGKIEELSAGDSLIVGPDIQHGVRAFADGCLIDAFTPPRKDFLKGSNK